MLGSRLLRLSLVFLVPVALLQGCAASRVSLPKPPAKTADEETRKAYYERHAPLPRTREDVLLVRRPFAWTPFPAQVAVTLQDGTRVEELEALLPAIDAKSPTAEAIRTAQASRLLPDSLLAAGTTLVVGGSGALVAGFVVPFVVSGGAEWVGLVAPFGVPAVLAGLVAMAAGSPTSSLRADTLEAETRAYATYDASLRERLGLPAASTTVGSTTTTSTTAASTTTASETAAPAAP